MKIALVGSAPSSVLLAPYRDPSWQIWGCSPGVYYQAPRTDAWFELHRFEPPVLGKPSEQRPWFSPEYCAWMSQHPCVWMSPPIPSYMIKGARAIPWQQLVEKYGHFNFTSSLAWMAAMAIEAILESRAKRTPDPNPEEDAIGFWGVDMAATEEYGYQRAGCQFFIQIAASLKIGTMIPPESDLMVPPPLYGISEYNHRAIKWLTRKAELTKNRDACAAAIQQANAQMQHLNGAIDDLQHVIQTWTHEGDAKGTRFEDIFATPIVATPEHDAAVLQFGAHNAQGSAA